MKTAVLRNPDFSRPPAIAASSSSLMSLVDVEASQTASRSLLRIQLLSNKVDSSSVAKNTQSTDNSYSLVAQIAVVPPRFPSMNIANMHFDERNLNTKQSISNGNRCVREPSRVDDDEVAVPSSFLNAVDDVAFVVGLECAQ